LAWRKGESLATIECGTVQFHNIQAVIFDKDGTLADSRGYLRTVGQRRARLIDAQIPGVQDPLLMAFGLQGDRLNLAGLVAVGTRAETLTAAAAYIAETGRDWVEALKIAEDAFFEADQVLKRKADHTPLVDGAIEVLAHLSQAGLGVGIVSSDTTDNTQDFVDRYELGPWVQATIGCDLGISKPDPDLFYKICDRLAVSPASTLVIGDSAADIEMARRGKAAGCIAMALEQPYSASLDLADCVVKRFSEIKIFT
jgi:phosphoglycolate phosphatase